MNADIKNNERNTAAAFSKQAIVFDEIYSGNSIVQYKRERVRSHVSDYLQANDNILELNSGTGEDAIWFAKKGHCVHATDLSAGMQNILKRKINNNNLDHLITHELCSFSDLDKLKAKGPYNYIFSNFAGLNCTQHLDKVLHSFSPLLTQGGIATLVILPKFCLCEFLLLFKGKIKTAFRRFFSSHGRTAHIEGQYFKCWYYNPSYIIKHASDQFEVLSVEGLCTFVPPSYIENFAEKYPRAFKWLKEKENRWKKKWPWRSIGDYYIISLRKKEASPIA